MLKQLARQSTARRCSWSITTRCGRNYAQFQRYLPRVQAYYAVKANPDPAIVRTLYQDGASFDVASMPEFMIVHENIKDLPAKERQDFIWDKIIYANPIKANETLEELDQYKPLVTFDNLEEIRKIKQHAPHAGLALRLKVPNTGAMVELSSQVRRAAGRGGRPDRGRPQGRAWSSRA